MSTTTKIFIVLHVIFSVAFVAWSVQFAAEVHDWKQIADDYELKARQADAYARNATAISAARIEALNRKIEDFTEQNKDLAAQLQTTIEEHNATKLKLAEAQRMYDGLNASFNKLSEHLKMVDQGWKAARAQRDKLDQDNITLQTRNQDLTLRNDELSSANLILDQQVRQLKQQNYALREQTAQLQSKLNLTRTGPPAAVGPKLDGVSEATPVAASPIRGTVTEISGTIASIDVGSADGVRTGMNFVIHRSGGKYIGELVVSDVEPNQAAGRLTSQDGVSPKVGDLVTDEAGLGKR